ncbi:MAG: sugar phosphate isomerase/epimerase family protein [Bacteroidales bacterium]
MITRRNFLKSAVGLLASSALLPEAFAAESFSAEAKKKQIGLQLYSVRNEISRDFMGTLQQLAKIGFPHLEAASYSNGKFYGRDPKEFQKILADMGMRLSGSHTGSGLLAPNDQQGWDFWKQNMAATVETGAEWIVQASYPEGQLKTIADVKRLAEQFNKLGEMAKAHKLRFAFHNHVTEFHPLDGELPYDVMLQNTDPKLVTFQMDTCQVLLGGGDCVAYVNKYPGRFANWHLKDAHKEKNESTEFGKGRNDFESLFAVSKKAGLSIYYIEQEAYTVPPLEAVAHDYNFLMNAKYVKW